ncbi:fungal chitin synthase [Anaeromyces robustus]|uniref:chitin synthase n=1 Tax=Anaeromyces robustus TaxID=1754192 RepID=A0A1Y1WVS8_9FUNG|nr:fungal chitin synthase [Anaeromyces robustus]|eukprot:ORX77505.1 fungal chitin synthase [Anaeromyces robustus]
MPEDYVICLITCYSEKEVEIRKTFNSLTVATYNDDRKLLFIVVDGVITGSGNMQTTSDIILSMLEIERWSSRPMSYCYESVGEIDKQTNMACVYAGYYRYNCRSVPVILVVKCGKESECNDEKPGNRGKRDSQLILMKFLSAVTMNKKMTALEYDLFKKIYQLTRVYPDQYNYVLMIDADTEVHTEALLKMVRAMNNDPKIMGLCGETQISNKFESWVTMIQIFEYFITHHLGKAFESVFGGVTCLPGCFSMYRIKSEKDDKYFVPILTSPAIVNEYASNDVNSLHRKNLFLLGEDRYLTTLMLKNFPRRKTVWVASALCKTQVPSKFHVLLSQRRRWINSTIHNLLELVMVPQLCGIFCCSMQFVILLELLSTIVLPAFFVLLLYLIFTGLKTGYIYLTLGFVFIFIFFQVILIFTTSQNLSYLFWMFIYILAYPIWNFLLPIYAFWHFDNFSWGATRKIKCSSEEYYYTKGYKKLSRDNLVKKYWYQWEYEKRYHDRERMEYKIKKMRKRLNKYRYM